MNQSSIEKAVGINEDIAKFMMTSNMPSAKSAMNLLGLQVSSYDPAGFAMLQCAVDDCKRDMEKGIE